MSILELEQKFNDSMNFTIIYNVPIDYSLQNGLQQNSLQKTVNNHLIIVNDSEILKAFVVIDPYNVPVYRDEISDKILQAETEIFGDLFYIKKLLSWQGPDQPYNCLQLTNYKKNTGFYNDSLFYCNDLQNLQNLFQLNGRKIISKVNGFCLQYILDTDPVTGEAVPFQFRNCSDSNTLQEFSSDGQFLFFQPKTGHGTGTVGSKKNVKTLFATESTTEKIGNAKLPINEIYFSDFQTLTPYGRNLDFPYRVYQFYFEPVNGFNNSFTVINEMITFTKNENFLNFTKIIQNLPLENYVNRFYKGYQKERKLPFPILPNSLLFTYIFLPIGLFIGSFVLMFICVLCCCFCVYIKRTYFNN
ncbi:hypothetical protein ABK040_014571 [Willaertia magna]